MADHSAPPAAISCPKQVNRHIFAVLAIISLAAGAGLYYYFNKTVDETLTLGAGMELRYRDGLTDILCDEAQQRHLTIDLQWMHQPQEAIDKVAKHELDAAIIPAGLTVANKDVRQVTMMDSQVLHLFAKPELAAQGLAALKGRMVFLGTAGSGVHCVAEEVLKFGGLTLGKDYIEDGRGYDVLMKASSADMPDAVFSLSPLPSPMGDRLARQLGYQLMELPMGESLAMRKPAYEDATIPPDTYGAAPAVPAHALHTVAIRGMMIANAAVPSIAVERLLEVLYEGDFARRANLKKMDPAMIQRAGIYPFHRGTIAYMHRGDPWHIKELMSKVQGLLGSMFSVFSAILLAWQWIRRKKVEVGEFQQECTNLDLDAQRAACEGEFGDAELGACMTQLSKLKADLLEQYHQEFMRGDKSVVDIVARIEGLQHVMPSLVRTRIPPKRLELDLAQPPRRAG